MLSKETARKSLIIYTTNLFTTCVKLKKNDKITVRVCKQFKIQTVKYSDLVSITILKLVNIIHRTETIALCILPYTLRA